VAWQLQNPKDGGNGGSRFFHDGWGQQAGASEGGLSAREAPRNTTFSIPVCCSDRATAGLESSEDLQIPG
jgi:hypothetical protein